MIILSDGKGYIDAVSGETVLSIWQSNASGQIRSLGKLTGPRLEAVALREADGAGLLVRAQYREESAELRLSGAAGDAAASRSARWSTWRRSA